MREKQKLGPYETPLVSLVLKNLTGKVTDLLIMILRIYVL